MTKKELLENKVFKNMPDDTRIVFNTSVKGEHCVPLKDEDMSFRSEVVGWAQKDIKLREEGIYEKVPIVKYFLVINTNPY